MHLSACATLWALTTSLAAAAPGALCSPVYYPSFYLQAFQTSAAGNGRYLIQDPSPPTNNQGILIIFANANTTAQANLFNFSPRLPNLFQGSISTNGYTAATDAFSTQDDVFLVTQSAQTSSSFPSLNCQQSLCAAFPLPYIKLSCNVGAKNLFQLCPGEPGLPRGAQTILQITAAYDDPNCTPVTLKVVPAL